MAMKAWVETRRSKSKIIGYRVRYSDASGRRCSEPGVFEKWHDAEALKNAVQDRLFNARLGRADTSLSTPELMEKWLLDLKAGLANKKAVRAKPGTLQTYRSTLASFIEKFPKIALVNKETFNEWRLEIEENDYSEHTLCGQLGAAKNFLMWCYRRKFIAWDCRDDISVSQPEGVPRYYSDEEISRLDQASCDDPMRLGYWLGRKCGMRRGEVLRADKRDIRWLAGGRGTLTIWANESKTKRNRTIPIPASVMALIGSRGEGLLYPGATNRTFEYAWAHLKAKAGIQEAPNWYHRRFHWARGLGVEGLQSARFHDLRHTFCRLFIESGAGDIKKLAAITGHKDLNILHNIYGHFETKVLHDSIDIMEARASFGGVTGENFTTFEGTNGDMTDQDGTSNESERKHESI